MNNKMRITSRLVKELTMKASIVGGLCMAVMTCLAQGTMMFNQQGDASPGVLCTVGGAKVGPVADDLGHDAWQIDTMSGGQGNAFGYYSSTLTSNQWMELTDAGWKLTAVLRVLEDASSGSSSSGMAVSVLPLGFNMRFGLNADTNTVVYVNGGLANTITGGGYHSYVLSDTDHDGFADLYVDGVLKENSIAARARSGSALVFGDLTTAPLNNGIANYSVITLEFVRKR